MVLIMLMMLQIIVFDRFRWIQVTLPILNNVLFIVYANLHTYINYIHYNVQQDISNVNWLVSQLINLE